MARELSESRVRLIEMFEELDKLNEQQERETRIRRQIEEYRRELDEIGERAYQAAKKAEPERTDIVREKCPIIDEADKRRALEIVEKMKDTNKLGDVEEIDIVKHLEGYGERNKPKDF